MDVKPPPLRQGAIYILTASVLWGTTGTAQAFAPPGAPSLAIGAVRLLIGSAGLLALAVWRGSLGRGQRPRFPTVLAALGVALYQVFFFTAVRRTGVAAGTIVAIGSAPILAGLLSLMAFRERPTRRWGLATAVALGGCALLFGGREEVRLDTGGLTLALLAGLGYATYAVSSKQVLGESSPDAAMAVVFCLAAILLAPALFAVDLSWLAEPRGLLVALHLGLVATAMAYGLFAQGLATLPVASAVTLSLAEPLTAGALGILLLGEQLEAPALAGLGLLLAGLVILSVDST